eukprot:CAMPEP_0114249908 /NCGR_PEP_ID=MMETSP0058-20121206/14412_1 /TAXON_ID=36894 /ORGANISM="Pyramimonas parkeae, CCMP726" /LENGTH=571 /DNA_ID=CAMNT_0001363523 /DNA_START=484 /DNA_END=2199 /DNA_ORIENTATION=+
MDADPVARSVNSEQQPREESSSGASVPKIVFITAGGRIKKAIWKGRDFDDLLQLHHELFYHSEQRPLPDKHALAHTAFALRDQQFGIFYEDFDIRDIYPGAVVEVSDPELLEEFDENKAHVMPAVFVGRNHEKDIGDAEGPLIDTQFGNQHIEESDSAGTGEEEADEEELPPLTVREQIFLLLDDPNSSRGATMLTLVLLCLILFSTLTYCMETLPVFYEHSQSTSSIWWQMECFCILVFTIELLARVATCPNIREYFKTTLNCVDLVAILPFYIEVILQDLKIPGLAVFRVVRLVRVFRLFKVSQGALSVFGSTMKQSARPLYMLVFFTSIAMIVFSSLIYYAERGIYDEELKMWMRVHHWQCQILIRKDAYTHNSFPPLNTNFHLESGHEAACEIMDPQPVDDLEANEAYFKCPFSWQRTKECDAIYEESPFESIPASFWWCLVTMTTVGYGDMYPTYWYGKMIGMVVMMFGILVIALPITVIGSNFAVVYKRVVLNENTRKSTFDRRHRSRMHMSTSKGTSYEFFNSGVYTAERQINKIRTSVVNFLHPSKRTLAGNADTGTASSIGD